MKPHAFLLILALCAVSVTPAAQAANTDTTTMRPVGQPSGQILVAQSDEDTSCTGDDCDGGGDIILEGE